MWGEPDKVSKHLEEKFESNEEIRKFSEQLKHEQKEWFEYRKKAMEDVAKCRAILKEFRQVVIEYKKVMDSFMGELENIKEFKQVVDLNKQIVELLQK